jgi:hypothetical protein
LQNRSGRNQRRVPFNSSADAADTSGRPRHLIRDEHPVVLRSVATAKGSTTPTPLEGARQIVRGQAPGRYDVDEIRGPFASGHTSRGWGRLIRHPDGRIEAEPHP